MFQSLLKKVFGTKHDRQIRKVQPMVSRINELGKGLESLEDHQVAAKTVEFKERLSRGESLDDLLPEAFATVREAAWRVLKMKHYDVQLIGGIAMHQGKIVEMRTGEGKTLTATTAMYLNALSGRGAHLITVNDYLASRDAEWMGQVYGFLGLSTGAIVHGLWALERQRAYRSDITYGTNNEFGFDYLRDNMKETIEKYVQRELNYAIVDEVDSILIDEARTPLIISGESDKPANTYIVVDKIMPSLRRDLDYVVDEKGRAVQLTDAGVDRIERLLDCQNLYAAENAELLHHVQQAMRAHTLYKKGVQYLVQNNQVVIVDEFTGRKMPGRRWSDGLHQAIEAKENVAIQPESQTLATITYQNYFRMYDKLAGMTGTADTEAEEFHQIYGLDVMVIPTHRPISRKDQDDLVYKNERGKFKAVVADIRECHERGQPVLVGTASVEKSEVLHQLLDRAGIPHNVLNAKNHGREAQIVAQAGRKHAVTVATNMAGRGTDIVLGGNAEMMAKGQFDPEEEPEKFKQLFAGLKEQCDAEKKEVLALGGLRIVGTERHESRRIDNQLRGRSGRQGDPGSSQFYLSLEDDLMRIFGADRITGLMERLGMEEDVPIEAPLVNRSIENAQEKVEAMHFDTRKNLFEYDNVMNEQRKAIYALRKQILEGRYVPEILDEEARKEQREKLPPPPETSGDHTIASLSETISDRVEQILDAHCLAVMESRGDEPAEGDAHPFPADGVQWRELVHSFYKVYGAVVPLEDIADDRAKILARARETIAASLIQQRERIHDLAFKSVEDLVLSTCPEDVHPDDWDLPALEAGIKSQFKVDVDLSTVVDDVEKLIDRCWDGVEAKFRGREKEYGLTVFLSEVRRRYLGEIDDQWIAHLKNIEHLRTGIGLVGYATRNPKNEYKIQGFNLFRDMWANIEREVLAQVVELSLTEEQRQRALEGAEIETRLTRHATEREAINARARARRMGGTGGPGQVNPQQAAALQEAARRALAKLQGRTEGGAASAEAAPAPKSAEEEAAEIDDAAERAARAAAAKAASEAEAPSGGGRRRRRRSRETA